MGRNFIAMCAALLHVYISVPQPFHICIDVAVDSDDTTRKNRQGLAPPWRPFHEHVADTYILLHISLSRLHLWLQVTGAYIFGAHRCEISFFMCNQLDKQENDALFCKMKKKR